VAEFQKASGHSVKITFNTAPQIRKRIGDGEVHDVVVAPPAVIDDSPRPASSARTAPMSAGSAWASRSGPARRTGHLQPEALKKSVLDAESLVFNRASTGIYLENLLKKMGVYDQVEKKTTRYDDAAAVMEHVLKGKGREIGFAPITEILLPSRPRLAPGRSAARRGAELHQLFRRRHGRRALGERRAGVRPLPRDAAAKKVFVAAGSNSERANLSGRTAARRSRSPGRRCRRVPSRRHRRRWSAARPGPAPAPG
jgi:hypothetical protein